MYLLAFFFRYIVTEYAGNSLYEILKRERETGLRILTPEHHKFIIYQLLRALKYIHSANVIFSKFFEISFQSVVSSFKS